MGIKVIHCHPSPHEGETLTINYLRHQLTESVVIANYYLQDGKNTLEIDVVVININGVYLLEVKHWYGAIDADQIYWRHSSGDVRPSPIPIIEHKARLMSGFLKERGWDNLSVVGLVVLSKGAGTLTIRDPNSHKVFGLHESLIHAISSRGFVFRPTNRILRGSEIEKLRTTIVDSHVKDAERRVAGYRVQKEQNRQLFVELIAEDTEISGRKVRIKQYDVPTIGSSRELEKAVNRFKRDMTALFQTGYHPALVMPYQFLRDDSSDERYYLILEWAGDRTLSARIAEDPIQLEEQIRILKIITSGLAHCHNQGVFHRNLSPSSIYLTADGSAKVGDFDFAKVPAISRTLVRTGKMLVSGRHISPEQALQAHDIDQRADIYSLGTIWYDMLFRPSPNEFLDRKRIDEANLPNDGKAILHMLLAERRADRPSSMLEVQEFLRLLDGSK